MRKGFLNGTVAAVTVVLAIGHAMPAFAAAQTNVINSVYTQGSWVKNADAWYFTDSSGNNITGWVKTNSGWYYFLPESGKMAVGWQLINGQRYYFNTASDGAEGSMRTGWLQQSGAWYFLSNRNDQSEGAVQTGWQWIDGKCYYFDASVGSGYGRMYAGGETPDGYKVNRDGQWIDDNGEVRTGSSTQTGNGFATVNAASSVSDYSRSSRSGSSSGSGSASGSSSSGSNGSSSESNTSGSESSGSGSGSTSSGGSSGSSEEKPENVSLFDEEYTDITAAGSYGSWIPIVFDQGYDISNVNVTVDGKNVNSALTKVTTDGSIVKLPLKYVDGPSEITVTSKNDSSKSETAVIGCDSQSAAIYTDEAAAKGYLPQKVLMHGAVSVWDYHLSNLYDDGSVRVHPDVTTFDLSVKTEDHSSYSPDTEIDENGVGQVEIMFNYNTDEEKAWFDSIKLSDISIVDYDTKKDLVKRIADEASAEVAKNADVDHYGGKVGTITFNSGCVNFRSNGRYYVRVKGSNNKPVLVPIHLVNAEAPVLKLTETPQSGKNLHFAVENMVYGINSPIESVSLTDPDGNITKLNNIDDYFIFGDTFVLYNDNVNHFTVNGNYTITINAVGFKTFSKSFAVSDAIQNSINLQSMESELKISGFDAVTTASVSGGGSGSGDSDSGTMMSADIVFDTDLLVNAMLLHDMGKSNADAEAVLDRYYDMTAEDMVFDIGSNEGRYNWTGYINACEEARVNGRILSFAEYKKNGELDPDGVYAFKEVLQDGLLGETQSFDQLQAVDYAKFEVPTVDGDKLIFKLEEEDKSAYIKAIEAITFNGSWSSLTSDVWSADTEKGMIEINTATLKLEHGKTYSFKFAARGYKDQNISFTFDAGISYDLELRADYGIGSENFKADSSSKLGDATFTVIDANGEAYSKFLNEFRSGTSDYDKPGIVKLDGETLSVQGVYSISKDALCYEISADKTQIILHNVKSSDEPHTLTLSLDGKTIETRFVMTAAEEEKPGEIDVKAKSVEYVSSGSKKYYRIALSVSGDGEDKVKIPNYLGEISKVIVNGKSYSKGDGGFWGVPGNNEWVPGMTPETSAQSNYKDAILLAANGFDQDENEIEIIAEGYETLQLIVDKSGNIIEKNNSEEKEEIEVNAESVEYVESFFSSYYKLKVKVNGSTEAEILKKYFDKIEVYVNGVKHSKAYSSSSLGSNQWATLIGTYGADSIALSVNGFDQDENEVEITAEGYAALSLTVDKDGKIINGSKAETLGLKDNEENPVPTDTEISDSKTADTELDETQDKQDNAAADISGGSSADTNESDDSEASDADTDSDVSQDITNGDNSGNVSSDASGSELSGNTDPSDSGAESSDDVNDDSFDSSIGNDIMDGATAGSTSENAETV